MSIAAPFIRTVVLNWNASWFTSRCLLALQDTDYPDDRHEVVLVDNGSTDGSLELLRARFPCVRILANHANLGFAEGCNRGMRDLEGVDMVALVNNDAVVEPGWLRPLVDELLDHHDVGAAAAMLLLEPRFAALDVDMGSWRGRLLTVELDGRDVTDRCRFVGAVAVGNPDWPLEIHQELDGRVRIWVPAGDHGAQAQLRLTGIESPPGATLSITCGQITTIAPIDAGSAEGSVELDAARAELLNGIGTTLTDDLEGVDIGFGAPASDFEVPERISGFCGGGALIRSSVLAEVGVFDPAFFAYYEDTDLSWRIRRAGWRIAAVPAARIHHAFGGAGGSSATWFFFLNYRNWLLTVLRNGTRSELRRAVLKAADLSLRSVRGNVVGRARRGHRPSFRLTLAWLSVWGGVLAAAPRILWSRASGRAGGRTTDTVGSRLQPAPGFPVPKSRPGGPTLVYVDREVLRDTATHGRPWRFDVDLDLVVVRWADGSWWRCTPAEIASLVGVDPATVHDPGARAVDHESYRLDDPDPHAVFVGAVAAPSAPRGVLRAVSVLGSARHDTTDLVDVIAASTSVGSSADPGIRDIP